MVAPTPEPSPDAHLQPPRILAWRANQSLDGQCWAFSRTPKYCRRREPVLNCTVILLQGVKTQTWEAEILELLLLHYVALNIKSRFHCPFLAIGWLGKGIGTYSPPGGQSSLLRAHLVLQSRDSVPKTFSRGLPSFWYFTGCSPEVLFRGMLITHAYSPLSHFSIYFRFKVIFISVTL